MMKKIIAALAVLLACFISRANADSIKILLSELAPVTVVDLRCTNAEYGVKIPIANRWKTNRGILRFSYVNSSALLPQNSRLVVKLNGFPLAQIRLNPAAPEGVAEIELPGKMFHTGYNDLTFMVNQHYTTECEDICAPELWTTLKLDEATIEFNYSLKPVPLQLSSIANMLFDPKEFPSGKVNIILDTSLPEYVEAAGLVASGIALRFDYRKVIFTNSADIRQGCDNILIGSKTFVQEFLERKGIPFNLRGPSLKILHLPTERPGTDDVYRALIVVSGENPEHIRIAAETAAVLSFSDVDEIELEDIEIPQAYSHTGRQILEPGKKYSFQDLNLRTYTFKGRMLGEKEFTFYLPTDLLIKPNKYADINLHFVYGAGMRKDSVLNILLNGKHVTGIRLSEESGGVYSNYKVSIPTYLFKRGMNTLSFEPVLTPSFANPCEFIQTENLFLTLFEDSSFYFPDMPHLVDLPRIELFFQDGFPFTRWPDGRETKIFLPECNPGTIGAALNLIGLTTQKVGYPLFRLKVAFRGDVRWEGESIVIGRIDAIPESLKALAPLKLTAPSIVPYPLYYRLKGQEYPSAWNRFKRAYNSLFRTQIIFPAEVDIAFSKQKGIIALKKGALMQFQSPKKSGRSVFLFTAADSEDVEELSRALLEPAVQAQCHGDFVIIDIEDSYAVSAWTVGPRYYSGDSGKVASIFSFLYVNLWLFFTLIIVVILILGFGIYYLLKKYRERRLSGV